MTQRATIIGIERTMQSRDLPHRYKTATCDACGVEQHEQGDMHHAAGLLRQEGWFVGERRGDVADCLCPRCTKVALDQI